MNTFAFLCVFGLSLGGYFFGDFNTLFGVVPDGGSALNAVTKGGLLGVAVWVLINKLRDFITIPFAAKFLLVTGTITSAYFFEAGKVQRQGRNLLAKHFNKQTADGAWIHQTQKGEWAPNGVLIEFTQTDVTPARDFPLYRKISFCNLKFQGIEELLTKIPSQQLTKASFYWSQELVDGVPRYKVVGLLSDSRNWFFEGAPRKHEKNLSREVIENARVINDDGTYVDQSCSTIPNVIHKKLYAANNILKGSWDEKDGNEKLNEMIYDPNGRPLSGQLAAEFVYFVSQEEAFQKGFGKAGMLKCVGFYTYHNGVRHGPYEFYYPGRIARAFVGQYENGVQVGTQKQFNPNGTLKKSWDLPGPEIGATLESKVVPQVR